MTLSKTKRNDEGAALITVLGLLVVFMMLGTAWVGYMMIEHQETDWKVEGLHASYAARGGINAGIAAVQSAIAEGASPNLSEPIDLEVPVYRENTGAADVPEASDRRVCRVRVQLQDESARVNINHAPPNVLREILQVDGEKARQIRSSLPRTDGADDEGGEARRWFSSVDELVTRGFLAPEALSEDLAGMLTVYTVPDPVNAGGYMNVNTAPAPVLQALLNVTPETATQVANARPFGDIAELSAAAGKDPATFNVRPAPDALNTLPPELSFSSRCYRIFSTAELVDTQADESGVPMTAVTIEAVACVDDQGNTRIMYWNESGGRGSAEPNQESEPEAPAA
ncbi:MAG: general secretion pathway protein GspK [Candidatus Hydrogenedentes bacterium]|nr:general secretion pathway protein GspK [Candidatus Hydrogenedentota bacterium]